MDPFSITTGVLAIATVAAQSSSKVLKIIKDIRGAPKEVDLAFRDVHACHANTCTLMTILEDARRHGTDGDPAILEAIQNLEDPLRNCTAVLCQLVTNLEKGPQPDIKGGRSWRKSVAGIKWSVFAKEELKDLQRSLEARKATLGYAVQTLNAYGR